VTLQVIVEGHGEVEAVGVLLRRLQAESGAYSLQFARPQRRSKPKLLQEGSLKQIVEAALTQEPCDGILILFDGEDECTEALERERGPLGPQIERWARQAARGTPCAVVVAYREYESWFLASIESLRGIAGIGNDAAYLFEPETHRDAKQALGRLMSPNSAYNPTDLQPTLTHHFDMAAAHRRSRSFRRMVRAFGV
jgi:hypothetical protein